MAEAGGLGQGTATSGAGPVAATAAWSSCSPWISRRRARRRSRDDWVPLWRASKLVLSSRHFWWGGRHRGSGAAALLAQP